MRGLHSQLLQYEPQAWCESLVFHASIRARVLLKNKWGLKSSLQGSTHHLRAPPTACEPQGRKVTVTPNFLISINTPLTGVTLTPKPSPILPKGSGLTHPASLTVMQNARDTQYNGPLGPRHLPYLPWGQSLQESPGLRCTTCGTTVFKWSSRGSY